MKSVFVCNPASSLHQLMQDNQKAVHAYNMSALLHTQRIVCICLLAAIIIGTFIDTFRPCVPGYATTLILCFGIAKLFHRQHWQKYTLHGLYLMVAVLALITFYISLVMFPNRPTAIACMFFGFIPMLFIDRPIRYYSLLGLLYLLYGVLVLWCKGAETGGVDAVNALISAFAGIFLGLVFLRLRLGFFEAQRQLFREKATDVLTDLEYKNPVARRFVIPMSIFALAALLEVLNYKFRFTNNLSFFFQTGSVLFILSLAVLCIHFMQESLKMKEEKKQMNFSLLLAEQQTEVQRHQYAVLTEHEKVLREQRHDLRHQLIVLKSYSMENDQESLQNYIDELTAKIPVEKDLFLCRNFVMNSMALYFRSLAKKQQIDLTLQLAAIGEKNGPIQDSDLCVILGNLLENAIEASAYLPAEQRRITLTSRIYNKKLFILMDNSYDGFCSQKSGVFYSRKRADKGTGLASIETVASKYHGMVSFEPGDKNFVSSVYLELTEEYTVP